MQFVASAGKWAWLKRAGEESELFRGGPSTAPNSLGKGKDWSEIALAGDDLWLLSRSGEHAELLHSMAGAAPVSTLKDLPDAGGLYAADGRLFWLESAPLGPMTGAFVPAADATGRLRVREATGAVRTLAEWPGGQIGRTGDVIGVANGQAYVRLRRSASTEFLRVPLAGGEWQRLAAESDTQQGVLIGDTLYWTAPTEESNQIHGTRCVRRLTASGGVETLTDWLTSNGDLHPGPRTPYYITNHIEPSLLELPDHLGEARVVRPAPPQAALDGDQLINLDGPTAPSVVSTPQR